MQKIRFNVACRGQANIFERRFWGLIVGLGDCNVITFAPWRWCWEWPWSVDDYFLSPTENITRYKGTRIRFDLQKLRNPEVSEAFQAMIGRRFALLTLLKGEAAMCNGPRAHGCHTFNIPQPVHNGLISRKFQIPETRRNDMCLYDVRK